MKDIKKIIKCTICADPSLLSSALDIFRFDLIFERVKKLFDLKLIDDEYLYYKVINNDSGYNFTSTEANSFN
jgi:hypothetical protein